MKLTDWTETQMSYLSLVNPGSGKGSLLTKMAELEGKYVAGIRVQIVDVDFLQFV